MAFEGASADPPVMAVAEEGPLLEICAPSRHPGLLRSITRSRAVFALRLSSLALFVAVAIHYARCRGTEEQPMVPPVSPFASVLGLFEEQKHTGNLTVSGLCDGLRCINGDYAFKGFLKTGRAWFAGGNRDEECFPEWIYYDPDPRRDGTVPAQWVFYGTQRAPWAKGDPKEKPEWDQKEYKELPEEDYKRHGYLVTGSKDVVPPETASWKVKCDMKGTWKEATISIVRRPE